MARFTITQAPGGAIIGFFPYDRILVEMFKETFSFEQRRYNEKGRNWFVAGPDAVELAKAWAETAGPQLAKAKAARKLAVDDQNAVLDAITEQEMAESVRYAIDNPIGGEIARFIVDDGVWSVATPFDPRIVEVMHTIPGSKFDGASQAWRIPAFMTEWLRSAIPEIEEVLADLAHRPAETRPDTRWLERADACPQMGAAFERDGEAVTPVDLGKVFPAGKKVASQNPALGLQPGDLVRYVYFRPSTPEEAEAMDVQAAAPSP